LRQWQGTIPPRNILAGKTLGYDCEYKLHGLFPWAKNQLLHPSDEQLCKEAWLLLISREFE